MSQCLTNSNRKRCLIFDFSLRFSKCAVALIALIAFLLQSKFLVLADSFLMVSGVFSIKSNILYQFYVLFLRKLLKDKSEPIQKESGELKFIYSMGGILLFVGFLLLYFEKFVNFAWILILTTSFFMFLGCFTDFCLAAAMYVFSKKFLKDENKNEI